MATFHKRQRKRKDGTIYHVWCGQEKINGKLKTVYGKTEKECKSKIKVLVSEDIVYGNELDKTLDTIADLLYNHLFTNVHPNVALSTFDRYMCLYNSHIVNSKFGNSAIASVKQMDIQEWFNSKKSVSKSGLSMLRYLLRQSFDFAVNNNYIRVNPVISIKLPKQQDKTKKEIEILSSMEQELYIQSLSHTKYRTLYLVALFTGMRRGEILALKWNNVDLKNKTITVCESRKRYKAYMDDGTSQNTIADNAPKTKNSNRIIPINDTLNKLLITHKLEQNTCINENNYVFINSNGTSLQPEYLRLMQQSICKRANIRYVSFHALRHTFATRLIESGTDIKTVSKLLGHSDVFITLNTYVHETMDSKRSATDVLEDRFKDFI